MGNPVRLRINTFEGVRNNATRTWERWTLFDFLPQRGQQMTLLWSRSEGKGYRFTTVKRVYFEHTAENELRPTVILPSIVIDATEDQRRRLMHVSQARGATDPDTFPTVWDTMDQGDLYDALVDSNWIDR